MKARAETETRTIVKGVTLHLTKEEAIALCAIHGKAYTGGWPKGVGGRASNDLFSELNKVLGHDKVKKDPIYEEVKNEITQPLDFRDRD